MRLAIIFIFILVSLFGANILMNNMDPNMPNCPFMNGPASLCEMSPLEHLNIWQSVFIATILTLVLGLIVARSGSSNNISHIFLSRTLIRKKDFHFNSPAFEVLRL